VTAAKTKRNEREARAGALEPLVTGQFG
jgi:hypothetical protein